MLTGDPARAQTCSGTLGGTTVAGNIYLNVPLSNGTTVQINPASSSGTAGGVFNYAECACATQGTSGIQETIQMTTPIPLSISAPGISTWIGTSADCSEAVNQNNSCVELEPPPTGVTLANFQATAQFSFGLPAAILTDPRGSPRSCSNLQQSSIVEILIGAEADPVPVTCTLSVSVNTIPPTVSYPANVTVASGDGALTVNVPTEDSGVSYYQVLCRDHSQPDTPLALSASFSGSPYYSTCVNGVINRRVAIPGSASSSTTTDAGTGTTALGAAALAQRGRAAGVSTAQDTTDMTSAPDLLGTADLGTLDRFHQFDPAFLCSNHLSGGGGSLSTRIDGLTNRTTYDILVLAIDLFGNATPYNVQQGEPVPAQNLGEALGPNYVGFGCSLAAAPLGPAGPAGWLIGAAVLLLLRRHRQPRDGA